MKTKKNTRRTKGEGSLIKLPNGKYKMTITVGKDVSGKQIRRSVTASSKQEVLDKIAALRLDKTPQQARELTFKQLYEEFERESMRDKTLATKAAYRTMWSHLGDELGNVKLNRITTAYISGLLLSMQNLDEAGKELSPTTLILNRRLLSAIFNFAVAKEYILRNPTIGALKGMREKKRADMQVISTPDLERLLKDAKEHDERKKNYLNEPRWYALILFAASSGLRRGEILGLRKSCVDVETGIVNVRAQVQRNVPDLPLKTKHAYRKIRVDTKVLELIMADADPESDFVFANRKTHSNWSLDTITSSFRLFMNFYNNRPFPEFSLHNLRHYHATQLLTAGIDVKSVSRRLGHADVRMTLDRYAHWLPEVDDKAKNIVGANLIKE